MYPSDLTDVEWALIRHHFEYSNGYGNRAIHTRRTLVNGILYVAKVVANGLFYLNIFLHGKQFMVILDVYLTWEYGRKCLLIL